GSCATCKASNITLKDFVEHRLRELVSPDITVEEASK
ncbi:MAG: NifU family protein, partial [Smithella sp.]